MDGKKILIIDDSEVLCQTIKAMIEENSNYEVQVETKANLGLAAAKQFNPNLLIIDILMPDIDGVSLAIHFKEDPATTEIPIMFLTAIAQEGDFIFGNVFGGYHVISKAVSTDKLIEAINKNINKTQ